MERTIVPDVISPQKLATLGPRDSVAAAVKLMTGRAIGALMVTERGRLVGIFTERDAMTRVLAKGKNPKDLTLADVMTPGPDTIRPDTPVHEALDLMSRYGYRHLPVVDGDRLIGIVSIRDLYRAVKDQLEGDILSLAEALIQG
ncbi:MAG: CBS domain-containing protein [Alphaproteobacteria bacterium]|nr:CBS domain-containing protein [Alphaproteobacteria bacterium]